jgi:ectoine hydroxylase-related dioxygenase (phytanoyl-CoA dioxygenase family)
MSPNATDHALTSRDANLHVDARTDADWLATTVRNLDILGCCVVEGAIDDDLVEELHAASYGVRDAIQAEVGVERLERAGELGVLRIPARFDQRFLRLLEQPTLLSIVDATVGDTAILHLQNGLLLPPTPDAPDPDDRVFQQRFHPDFPRYMEGYLASVNTFVTLDEFTVENGGTIVVPGTHQRADAPPREWLQRMGVPVTCPAGSIIAFDSTLWHAAGINRSGADRIAVNHQFTRSFIKQQVDYVRALGDDVVTAQPERTQQLLGWYTRVVTSLDEYYRPAEERLYRGGQG